MKLIPLFLALLPLIGCGPVRFDPCRNYRQWSISTYGAPVYSRAWRMSPDHTTDIFFYPNKGFDRVMVTYTTERDSVECTEAIVVRNARLFRASCHLADCIVADDSLVK